MIEQSDGTKHFNEGAAKLTHDRLIDIYKTASGYAHIINPYKPDGAKLEYKKKSEARTILKKDIAYLKSVIWDHVKIGLIWKPDTDPTQLENSESAWLIWFGNKDTDQIRIALASAIQDRQVE